MQPFHMIVRLRGKVSIAPTTPWHRSPLRMYMGTSPPSLLIRSTTSSAAFCTVMFFSKVVMCLRTTEIIFSSLINPGSFSSTNIGGGVSVGRSSKDSFSLRRSSSVKFASAFLNSSRSMNMRSARRMSRVATIAPCSFMFFSVRWHTAMVSSSLPKRSSTSWMASSPLRSTSRIAPSASLVSLDRMRTAVRTMISSRKNSFKVSRQSSVVFKSTILSRLLWATGLNSARRASSSRPSKILLRSSGLKIIKSWSTSPASGNVNRTAVDATAPMAPGAPEFGVRVTGRVRVRVRVRVSYFLE
mmetsp:Transcript_46837/g.146159  ORF Transcript_46837/g.146159 Transcript_46837/m.146159 type:complete len:300 (-) Transcript_46837:9-908(-)